MRKTGLGILLACGAVSGWACDYQYPVSESHGMLYRIDKSGQPRGLLVDLAGRLSDLTDCRLTPLPVPMARRNAMFGNGRLFIQLGVQEGMQGQADFVPLLRMQLYLMTVEKGFSTAEQALAAPGVRIGMLNGVHLAPAFLQKLQSYRAVQRIEYSNDRDSLLRKLGQRRVPVAFDGASWAGVATVGQGVPLYRLAFSPPLFIRVGMYLSHRIPPADRVRLAAGMQRLAQEGVMLAEIRKGLQAPAGDLLPVESDQSPRGR